jgi:hypothetical protein
MIPELIVLSGRGGGGRGLFSQVCVLVTKLKLEHVVPHRIGAPPFVDRGLLAEQPRRLCCILQIIPGANLHASTHARTRQSVHSAAEQRSRKERPSSRMGRPPSYNLIKSHDSDIICTCICMLAAGAGTWMRQYGSIDWNISTSCNKTIYF